MAGLQLVFKTKVKASTLLEVIIAMVVIMLVFGTAMMIFTNITLSTTSVKKIQAQAILNETAQAIEKSKVDSGHLSFASGDLRIDQTVKSYIGNINLLEIDLTVYDANQKKITELHKVILNNHD